ncbi:SprA-related family protein [Thermodesulfobium acidiphilum]|uniref:SprA-related family protein n=1 Tax=Thermodesulfobium acidiphilum TaxID=1794699 RepID=A0A2R4VYW9_THEAF|nr:putative metalloprotease CJM1_0395 family protein [Thermodesulfobium acidiphilum]AWB09712.1 SprA-related family protein [Thermodesulfobium acidiphilum]
MSEASNVSMPGVISSSGNSSVSNIANLNNSSGSSLVSSLKQKFSAQVELEIEQLRKRDQEVRAHEQAHIAASGGLAASGPNYVYVTGPDGKLYAVGGDVTIDVSPVPNNPDATIQKMQTVIRAALAPAEPSSQDYTVASQAQMIIMQAQEQKAIIESHKLQSAISGNHNKKNINAIL